VPAPQKQNQFNVRKRGLLQPAIENGLPLALRSTSNAFEQKKRPPFFAASFE
jgi:hypothetical protein